MFITRDVLFLAQKWQRASLKLMFWGEKS